MVNLQEVIQKITLAGSDNVRIVPAGSGRGGIYNIEIRRGGVWVRAASGLSKIIADDIVKRASNRTICG